MSASPLPRCSIVVPLYNKEREILRAVSSVRAQTVTDWELIVVNDGSTDRGPEMVCTLTDPRIRVVNQENRGVSAARNRGIHESRAELVAFLDADDEWSSDYLETVLGLRDRCPETSVFAARYWIKYPDGRLFEARIHGLPCGFLEGEIQSYFCVAAQSDPPLCSSSVMVTRRAIDGVGGFPVGVTSGEDLLTWARLAVDYRIAYSTHTCATFYISGIDRVPDEPDTVGIALGELSMAHPEIACLRQCVALWHRMQLVMFLRRGDKVNARTTFDHMACYSGRGSDYLVCRLAAYSPGWLYRLGMDLRRLLTRAR